MLEHIFRGFIEWIYGLILECWEYFSAVLLDIMSMDFAYLRSHVPVIDPIMQSMLAVGWALLIGNLVFQAVRSMMTGLGFEAEDPKLLFTRTFVFSFLLVASPQICQLVLNMTSRMIEMMELPDAVDITFADEASFEGLAAAWLLVIICGIIVMFQSFKLIFEMAERYFILAVLTITSPLAFAAGGSRSTADIFSGWCRMYGSMCLLMVLNVVFVKMLLSVLSFYPSGLDVLPWLVLTITIVKVAKKIDAIITKIGLNPAITGDSLGRSFPGALSYLVIRTATSQITRSLGKGPGNGGTSPGGAGHTGPQPKGPVNGFAPPSSSSTASTAGTRIPQQREPAVQSPAAKGGFSQEKPPTTAGGHIGTSGRNTFAASSGSVSSELHRGGSSYGTVGLSAGGGRISSGQESKREQRQPPVIFRESGVTAEPIGQHQTLQQRTRFTRRTDMSSSWASRGILQHADPPALGSISLQGQESSRNSAEQRGTPGPIRQGPAKHRIDAARSLNGTSRFSGSAGTSSRSSLRPVPAETPRQSRTAKSTKGRSHPAVGLSTAQQEPAAGSLGHMQRSYGSSHPDTAGTQPARSTAGAVISGEKEIAGGRVQQAARSGHIARSESAQQEYRRDAAAGKPPSRRQSRQSGLAGTSPGPRPLPGAKHAHPEPRFSPRPAKSSSSGAIRKARRKKDG